MKKTSGKKACNDVPPILLEPLPLHETDPPQIVADYEVLAPAFVYGAYTYGETVLIPFTTDPDELPEPVQRAREARVYDLDREMHQAEQDAQRVLSGTHHSARMQNTRAIKHDVHFLRHAIERGDARQAALHGFWLARRVEEARVLGITLLVEKGRERKSSQKKGTAKQKEKGERTRKEILTAAAPVLKDTSLSLRTVAEQVSEKSGKKFGSVYGTLLAEYPHKKRAR